MTIEPGSVGFHLNTAWSSVAGLNESGALWAATNRKVRPTKNAVVAADCSWKVSHSGRIYDMAIDRNAPKTMRRRAAAPYVPFPACFLYCHASKPMPTMIVGNGAAQRSAAAAMKDPAL